MDDTKEAPLESFSRRTSQNAGDFQAIDPHTGVKRGLRTRHLSMMALAGIIGPGLLIGSGGEIIPSTTIAAPYSCP